MPSKSKSHELSLGSPDKVVRYISSAISRAVRIVRSMMKVRGYDQVDRLLYSPADKLYQLFGTRSSDGARTCALLTLAFAPDGPAQLLEVGAGDRQLWQRSAEASSAGTGSIGADFLKKMLSFQEEHKIGRLILVTDDLTTHVTKALASIPSIQHFSYRTEMCVDITVSQLQPTVFRTLKGQELADFMRRNPKWEEELPTWHENDPLVKFYGYQAGTIVRIEDFEDTTETVEWALIVPAATGKKKPKRKS